MLELSELKYLALMSREVKVRKLRDGRLYIIIPSEIVSKMKLREEEKLEVKLVQDIGKSEEVIIIRRAYKKLG